MSWRVLTRLGKDYKSQNWIVSKAIYDKENALDLFFSHKDNKEYDVMLVKEERFSSAVEVMEI